MPIKTSITLDEAIVFLDSLVKIDASALCGLIEHRVLCNDALADHPTVQVGSPPGEPARVGVLGILNGLFGANEAGWGPIGANFDDDGRLTSFDRTKQTL